jgi:hypothetical protein
VPQGSRALPVCTVNTEGAKGDPCGAVTIEAEQTLLQQSRKWGEGRTSWSGPCRCKILGQLIFLDIKNTMMGQKTKLFDRVLVQLWSGWSLFLPVFLPQPSQGAISSCPVLPYALLVCSHHRDSCHWTDIVCPFWHCSQNMCARIWKTEGKQNPSWSNRWGDKTEKDSAASCPLSSPGGISGTSGTQLLLTRLFWGISELSSGQ